MEQIKERIGQPSLPREDSHGMSIRVVTVTPEVAAEWLTHVPDWQRPLNRGKRDQIMRDLESGGYMLNGETIAFSAGGWLVNGQTRLSACVASGIPFPTIVVLGVADEAFATYDQMGVRTLSTVLRMRGKKHYNTIGALLRRLWQERKGYSLFSSQAPTIAEAMALLAECEEACERSANAAVRAQAVLRPSIGAYLHYKFGERDQPDADRFFVSLATGANLSPTSSIYHLRARLIADRDADTRMTDTAIHRLGVKAWNKYRSGEVCKQLKLVDGETVEIE